MPLLCKRISDRPIADGEQGSIIIMMTFVSIVLATVVALAIDAGNLYRSQLALQKAADAAALAGVGFAIQLGQNNLNNLGKASGGITQVLSRRTKLVAEANLIAADIIPAYNDANLVFTPLYDPTPNSATVFDYGVTLEKDIDYYLIDLIPFHLVIPGTNLTTGSTHRITATAVARRPVANVAVLLDLSDSMNCPSVGPCTCLNAGTCVPPLKIDDLVQATEEFLRMFDPNNDKLAAIPFNIAAEGYTLNQLAPNPGSITPADIKLIVDYVRKRYSPNSSTNICDAFLRAYEEMQNIAPNQEIAYMLIADGAPTAGRFLLPPPSVGALLPWNPRSVPGATHDYLHYSVEWVDSNPNRPGPSLLTQHELIPISWSGGLAPQSGDGITAPAEANCASTTAPFIPFTQNLQQALQIEAPKAFNGCVADLGFHVPKAPGVVYAAGTSPDDPNFDEWRKQYYNCAVVYSDFLRKEKGMVYTIGLGEPAAVSSDPYQDVNDVWSRKDFLLTRLANDYADAVTIPGQAASPWQHPEFNFTGYATYNNLSSSSSPRQGDYLPTPTTQEIQLLFRKIARKIQMRLVK